MEKNYIKNLKDLISNIDASIKEAKLTRLESTSIIVGCGIVLTSTILVSIAICKAHLSLTFLVLGVISLIFKKPLKRVIKKLYRIFKRKHCTIHDISYNLAN